MKNLKNNNTNNGDNINGIINDIMARSENNKPYEFWDYVINDILNIMCSNKDNFTAPLETLLVTGWKYFMNKEITLDDYKKQKMIGDESTIGLLHKFDDFYVNKIKEYEPEIISNFIKTK